MTKLFENMPVSELQKRLYGEPKKRYDHALYCNADRRKPIGCDMCICLRQLRHSCKGEVK